MNQRRIAEALACPICSTPLGPWAVRCHHCGRALNEAASSVFAQTAADPALSEASPQAVLPAQRGRRSTAPPRLGNRWEGASIPPDVSGTVIAVEPVQHEPVGFRLPVALHRVLLLFEFVALPLLLLRWWTSYAGALSLVVGVATIFLLFKFIMPVNLLSLVWLGRMFSPARGGDQQVPVRYARIRTADGREIAIRAKGRLRGASIMAGDEIAAWGRTRYQTLHLRRALNLRTGSSTRVVSCASWLPLLFNLLILGLLIGTFWGPVSTLTDPGGMP